MHAKKGHRWTKDEMILLFNKFQENDNISKLEIIFERSELSLKIKLQELGLLDDFFERIIPPPPIEETIIFKPIDTINHGKRYSEEDINSIKDLLHDGKSILEIARLQGRTFGSVRSLLINLE